MSLTGRPPLAKKRKPTVGLIYNLGRGAIPSKTVADAKVAIQEMVESSQKWHNRTSRTRSTKTSDGLAAIQAQLNNLGREIKKVNEKVYAAQEGDIEQQLWDSIKGTRRILHTKNKEIRASTDAAIRNQGASIKTLEIQIGQMSNVLQKRGFGSLPSSTEANPRDQVNSISTTIEADSYPIRLPLILGRPFLSTAHAKIIVYKRKITLRVEEERIVFTSVKPASSLIKRVYMLSLSERMELDLEVGLMGETLVLNRSLDPFLEDYIKLNDLNKPFELRRNQGDDLMPTIEEGEVIEEFRTRDDELDAGIDDYPSYCDYDKKIHHNLKFSFVIGFEFTHVNFFPLLYVNVMSKKFHNSIMKDKMVYKGNNVIGALMNVPIFVGNFFVVTDFAVLENMDDYYDEGMGDVIFGEPFLREVSVNLKIWTGYRVLIDLILHRSLINNSARLSNKFGGFYFIFKFGISGLLHQVITTIADRIRDNGTSQSKHNSQSSSTIFIYKTFIIPSFLDFCFISSTVSEDKRAMLCLDFKICAKDKNFSSTYAYTTMMLPRVHNHHGGKCGEVNPTHEYYNGSCTSKDNEDPSWSTSFKTRRTQKTSSALEDFICVVFVPNRNIVSEEDKMNEISHPYQNLMGFYKGVLNLGQNCIRGPRERNIDEYWWRIYKSGDLKVLES
ncbi:hypothetical protein Tco_1393651 [Tanacetum coccineum]